MNTKLTKNNLLSFVITIAALYFMRDYIAARAQLVTFILFIITVYFIEKFLETKQKRYVVGLIIIPIIIANIHLAVWPFYFILYMPYVVDYLITVIVESDVEIRKYKIKVLNKKLIRENLIEKIDKIKEKIEKLESKNAESLAYRENIKDKSYKLEITKNDNVKWLILIMIICAFTGLLTPVKDAPYTYLGKTMAGNTTQFINEHLPLTLMEDIEFLIVICAFLAILLFTDTKIKLPDFFMIAGLLLLAFRTRRQVSMFLLLGTIIFNRLMCKLFDKYDRDGCRKATKFLVTIPGIIATFLLIGVFSFSLGSNKIGNDFVNSSSYPVEAAEFIKENLDLKTIKLYNEYNYGSYLLMQDIPVFIDSRADLYSPEFNGNYEKDIFSDFIDANNIGRYYEDIFDKYEITHVMQYKNSRLNLFLSRNKRYKEIYSDSNFVIYERGAEDNT